MTLALAVRPMRETVRRRKVLRALDVGSQQAADVIARSFKARLKPLERDLRRGNLRKRMKRAEVQNQAVVKALALSWPDWISSFVADVKDALANIVTGAQDVESEYWITRGGAFDALDPAKVIADYEARSGHQIVDIATDTKNDVLTTIADWHNNPDQSFGDLMDSLGAYFDPARAETIARTEAAYIASQVSLDAMNQFGIDGWNWDLGAEAGGYPCALCIDLADGGPYKPGDPMPPDASHPRCRCGITYVMNEDDEL